MATQANTTVSILTEIPEDLHEALRVHLVAHKDQDQDSVLTAALSLYLLQNGSTSTVATRMAYKVAARLYLNTLFRGVA